MRNFHNTVMHYFWVVIENNTIFNERKKLINIDVINVPVFAYHLHREGILIARLCYLWFVTMNQYSCFIGFRRIPTKSGSESDWKASDKNSVGSDRFLMKNVGFRWNPMRVRSKATGSAGRIDSPGNLGCPEK